MYQIISKSYEIWYCLILTTTLNPFETENPGYSLRERVYFYEYDLTAEEIGQLLGGN